MTPFAGTKDIFYFIYFFLLFGSAHCAVKRNPENSEGSGVKVLPRLVSHRSTDKEANNGAINAGEVEET